MWREQIYNKQLNNTMIRMDNTKHDKFGQREYVLYGNGSYAKYLYDALQRLEELYSFTAQDEGMQEIKYAYDPVDNITDIHNGAVTLQNGLGGEYDYHHAYDNLYRLVNSSGRGERRLHYEMDMDYTPNGKIGKKHVDGVGEFNGGQYPVGADYGYTYHVGTNRMKEVSGHSSSYDHLFEWDANGNMLLNDDGQSPRHHCWDEENRLMLVRNGKVAAHYLYDANGERVYKVVGDNYAMNVNGAYQGGHAVLHTPALYTSPYVVATPKGYTKHYYAGSERIASRIGGGELARIRNHVIDPGKKLMQMDNRVGEGWRSHCFCREDKEPERSRSLLGIVIPKPEKPGEFPPCSENEYTLYFNTELRILYEYKEKLHDEKETYFYHPDHLGSSSWITNQDGDAIQHLQYLPFGEQYVDQRTTGWNAPYTFSGKERDEETGYSYFGARYYDSDLSIWLSVDPLAYVSPHLSPYTYCKNNPIMKYDPDGLTDYEVNGKTKTINDGVDNLKIKVSQREFNKLERKFNRGGDGYDKYRDKMSVKHGYTTFEVSDISYETESEAIVLPTITIRSHKAGGRSYSDRSNTRSLGEWGEGKPTDVIINGQTYVVPTNGNNYVNINDKGLQGQFQDHLHSQGKSYRHHPLGMQLSGNTHVLLDVLGQLANPIPSLPTIDMSVKTRADQHNTQQRINHYRKANIIR